MILQRLSGIAVYVDHSDMSSVEKLFQRIEQETQGQLDILVNNAFSAVKQIAEVKGRKFWEMEPGFWDEANNLSITLTGLYTTSRATFR